MKKSGIYSKEIVCEEKKKKTLQNSQPLVTKQPNYSPSTWQIHRLFIISVIEFLLKHGA